MARRNPPRKVTYFEPVLPRLARNTIIQCPTGWMKTNSRIAVWPRRDLSAGRPHGRRPSRRGGRISEPPKREPRRGNRGFKVSRSSRGICDRSLIRSKRRRNGIVASG